MVKLELTNCTNFQSGTALNIRKYCPNLRYLRLDIDSAEANSNAGLGEVLAEQNIHTLENQVPVKNYNHSLLQLFIFKFDCDFISIPYKRDSSRGVFIVYCR